LTIVRLVPVEAPRLPVPIPSDAQPDAVLAIIDVAEAAVARAERLASDLRGALTAEAAHLPDAFDIETVCADWNADRVNPMLRRGIFSEEWESALTLYVEVFDSEELVTLMPHWNEVSDRIIVLNERHSTLADSLVDLVADVLERERERR
jgi:hypothetical protein